MSDKQFLTPHQLVARWGNRISLGTLANWRSRKPKVGPAFTKIGGRVLYAIESIKAYEAAQTVGSVVAICLAI